MIENSMVSDKLYSDEQGLHQRPEPEYTGPTADELLSGSIDDVLVEAMEFVHTPTDPSGISEIDDAAWDLIQNYPDTKMAKLLRYCAEQLEERERNDPDNY